MKCVQETKYKLTQQYFLLMKTFRKDFPSYPNFFDFKEFNPVQLQCYENVICDQRNMIISAPTSSGKTVIFQLSLIKQLSSGKMKCLYLAPIKALCHEKMRIWDKKFKKKVKIIELTSDNIENDELTLEDVDITIATPQKIDYFSRKNLSFLSQINLLLVDEIHMLNFEERGATLEAVISRIMSLNNPRIIAVSATIPNINEVAQWLKVPTGLVKIFGEEFRPVPLNKVVLGFKSTNNPFTFERMLNFKLIETIRHYNEGGGSLVFCQTQKGTESACQQLVNDMQHNQFIKSDESLLALTQASYLITNSSLKALIPQGIAFHNAGLALQDRLIIEKLFLEFHLRVLCTTSTLSMGINLPARLVIIKSTQSYKGAGKGYQEYTQIEIDQMMGRAGRPPFDTKGTVVIMTEKNLYKKYLNMGKPENLESHFYEQISEHINAEISLRSLASEKDVLNYLHNTFCYIRMKKCPHLYTISNLEEDSKRICNDTLKKLSSYDFITFVESNKKIIPRFLGITVAKNSVSIDTMIHLIDACKTITNEKDFLTLICESEELKKIRNKIDERKLLKELNQKIKYPLKSAVSTPQKKCYVLLQTQLDGRYIENWQMRKQAKDLLLFLKRLLYCLKIAFHDSKMFWPYYWSILYLKFVNLKFWSRNEDLKAKSIPELGQNWKKLNAQGIKNIQELYHSLNNMGLQKNAFYNENVFKKLQNLKHSIVISYEREQCKGMVFLKFVGEFDEKMKSIAVIVGNARNQLYTTRTIKTENEEITIAIPFKKHYLGIVKEGYVGFDEFYVVSQSGNIIPFNPEQFKPNLKSKKHERTRKSEQKCQKLKERDSSFEIKPRRSVKLENKKEQNFNMNSKQKELKTIGMKKKPEKSSDNDFTMKRIAKMEDLQKSRQFDNWKPWIAEKKDVDRQKKQKIKIEQTYISQKSKESQKEKQQEKSKKEASSTYDYFYNLF